MKKVFTLGALLLLLAVTVSAQTKKVGMLIGSESISAIESADEKAAAEWFQAAYTDGVVVTPSTLSKIDDLSVLWVACDRVGISAGWANLPTAFSSEATVNKLKSFAENGGSLLLTNHATQLAVAIGRIAATYAPGIFGNGEGGQNDDVWGVHPIIGNVPGQIYDHSGHAIYKDMTYEPTMYAGIYCFEGPGVKGDHNCMWDLNAYGFVASPNVVKTWEETTNSTVLGTWNHVVDYCCAGIVDFAPTTTFAGRILAVGLASYEWDLNGGENAYMNQLQMFTTNCISYLLNPTGEVLPIDDDPTEPMAAVNGKVGLLIGAATVAEIEDDDEKVAAEWFQTTFGDDAIIITSSTLANIANVNTLWVPVDRNGIERGAFNLPEPFCLGDVATALENHVKAGGSLLLTNHATQLVNAIGRTTYEPTVFGAGEGGEGSDRWGSNANIGLQYDHSSHAIYTGLAKDNTSYPDHSFFPLIDAGHREDHNCMWDMNALADLTENPNKIADFEQKANAVVLGTWQHVTDYCCAGIIEFQPTTEFAGTVIANGLAAYEWNQNGSENAYQVNIKYLTWNMLQYLNSKSTKVITGISEVTNGQQLTVKSQFFDLQGRRLNDTPQKGVYITNGKKVLVR